MLILNAKSIGTGKRATSEYTDVTNVFFSTRANWYELIKFLKCIVVPKKWTNNTGGYYNNITVQFVMEVS